MSLSYIKRPAWIRKSLNFLQEPGAPCLASETWVHSRKARTALFSLFHSLFHETCHFDRSCSRFCEQRSGETRFSTDIFSQPKHPQLQLFLPLLFLLVIPAGDLLLHLPLSWALAVASRRPKASGPLGLLRVCLPHSGHQKPVKPQPHLTHKQSIRSKWHSNLL